VSGRDKRSRSVQKYHGTWTFTINFSRGTQFISESLMFVVGEDRKLELLTRGATPKHPTPVYGTTPHYPTDLSTLNGDCSGLNPHTRPYYLAAMTSQSTPIRATISQSSTGTSSSSSSGASYDRGSTEDYLEVRGSCYWNRRLRVALSARWPQHLSGIAPVGTPPSEDQKRSMHHAGLSTSIM
jgi:hypothetical protein